MIRIRSQKEGFRRCGVAHSKQWREFSDDFWSPTELQVLQAEPMLQVEIVADAEAEKEPQDDGQAGGQSDAEEGTGGDKDKPQPGAKNKRDKKGK